MPDLSGLRPQRPGGNGDGDLTYVSYDAAPARRSNESAIGLDERGLSSQAPQRRQGRRSRAYRLVEATGEAVTIAHPSRDLRPLAVHGLPSFLETLTRGGSHAYDDGQWLGHPRLDVPSAFGLSRDLFVSGNIALITNAAASGYELGSDHPMRAVRAELSIALAEDLRVLSRPGWDRVEVPSAQPSELALVHSDLYVGLVRAADRMPAGILASVGLGTKDTPVFPGIHDAASGVVGATVSACRSVRSGQSIHAVNLVGGLHHAMPGNASGFCVYNDAAVGIAELLAAGCPRVAYVDLDAHHGDGVEAVFRSDPRVLTISLHQDGRTIFPGTGSSCDVGAVGAEGTTVNLPLPMGTGDAGWLRGLSALVPVLLREFAPDIIVTQCGCDAHWRDPLTDLRVTVEGFTTAYTLMHDLAHELCGGRWVVLGGGGYDLGSAVPRTWTQLLAVCSGGALMADTVLPEQWRTRASGVSGQEAPTLLGDSTAPPVWEPWDAGDGDPDDPLDRAVAATRRAVLPLHGLDPFYDR